MTAIIIIACLFGLALVAALGLCGAASEADKRMAEIANEEMTDKDVEVLNKQIDIHYGNTQSKKD